MSIQRRRLLQAAGAASAVGLAGCTGAIGGAPAAQGVDGSAAVGDGDLVLATTTSTYDTGLLDALNPTFQALYGVTVKTLSRGTGATIRTARDGDADVILVHARGAEDVFLRNGFGVNRRDVMFNDFVVVGPESDPAGISGMDSATAAFTTIAAAEATFLSRGDDSGTHKKELQIWAQAGTDPSGSWYREVGRGMGATLTQATQVGGYTLADRGTFLSMTDDIDLVVHVQGPLKGGPTLLTNPYGVIPVNPTRHEDVNYQAAMAYAAFLTSPQGQTLIDNYTANGSQLFFPNALAPEPQFGQFVPQDYCAGSSSLSREVGRYQHWVETTVPEDY